MAYTPGDQDRELETEHREGEHRHGMTSIHCPLCEKDEDERGLDHQRGKHHPEGDPHCVLCLADRREALRGTLDCD